ncbi:IgE-binding protein, partial [Aspergillus arachidicola]
SRLPNHQDEVLHGPLVASSPAGGCCSSAPENPPFGVMSAHSASPIHLLPMTASGQKFYLGGKTQSYCPLPESKDCPPGTETVFSPGGYGLNVNVPGGQQVYVDPKGALSFTQAHSAYIPEAPPWVPSLTSPASNGATTLSPAGVLPASWLALLRTTAGRCLPLSRTLLCPRVTSLNALALMPWLPRLPRRLLLGSTFKSAVDYGILI